MNRRSAYARATTIVVWLMLAAAAIGSRVYRQVTSEEKIFYFITGRQQELSTFPHCLLDSDVEDGIETVELQLENNMTAEVYQSELRKRNISALNIEVGLSIIQLLAVSEREQTMTVAIRTYTEWTDCRLSWSPSNFNSVSNFTIPPERFRALNLFSPLVMLLEETNPLASQGSEMSIRINSSGGVSVHREYTTTISCGLNIVMYPFDSHSCNLTFETPFHSLEANLKYTEYESVEAESRFLLADGRFLPSDTWEVIILPPMKSRRWACSNVDQKSSASTEVLDCLVDRQTFRIILRRHPQYQVVNLFIPGFLCLFISACVFLIPPGGTDKFFLMLCILLSLFIFLNLMYAKMPETGSTLPLMSQFYFGCTIFISISCVVCSVTTTVAASKTDIPRWLVRMVLCLPFVLIGVSKDEDEQGSNNPSEVATKSTEEDSPFESTGGRAQTSSRNNKPRKYSTSDVRWTHVAWFFDLVYMGLVIATSVIFLTSYLIYGHNPPNGVYAGLLNEADWPYLEAQLALQGHKHPSA